MNSRKTIIDESLNELSGLDYQSPGELLAHLNSDPDTAYAMLTTKELGLLAYDPNSFKNILRATPAQHQKKVIAMIGDDLKAAIKSNTRYIERILAAVATTNIDYFIKQFISIDRMTALYDTTNKLNFLFDVVIPDYDPSQFICLLSSKQLQKYASEDQFNINFLYWIHEPERLHFIKNYLSSEKIKTYANSAYNLSMLLAPLSTSDKFLFLSKFFNKEELQKFKTEPTWQMIKTQFISKDDKIKLMQLVFEQQDIQELQTLKSIKQQIQSVKWTPGLFSKQAEVTLGKHVLQLPLAIELHAKLIKSVKNGQRSRKEAISAIKDDVNHHLSTKNNRSFFSKRLYSLPGWNAMDVYASKIANIVSLNPHHKTS